MSYATEDGPDIFSQRGVVNGKFTDIFSPCAQGICDYNFLRHAGWQEPDECIKSYFSQPTIDVISRTVSQLTLGVDKKNRKIIVPDSTICSVMDSVYQSYRPPTGDIFTRLSIPDSDNTNMVASMIDRVIEIIVSNIRIQTGMERANEKLTVWVQLMGDFNPNGLRQVPPIKTLEKRPSTMQFNMNY